MSPEQPFFNLKFILNLNPPPFFFLLVILERNEKKGVLWILGTFVEFEEFN